MNRNAAVALLGVAMMLVSAAGPALAAAPNYDTETTNTASTSELTDGATVTNFSADADTNSTIQAVFDSTNPGIEFRDPVTNEVLLSVDEADMTQTYSGTGTYNYNYTLNHGDLAVASVNPSSNMSMQVDLINDTSLDADAQDVANTTIYLETVDNRTVRYVGSAYSTDAFTFDSSILNSIPVLGGSGSATLEDSVPVGNASDATVTFALGSSSSGEAGDFVSNVTDAIPTDAEAGTWTFANTVKVNGDPVRTYVDEAGSDAPDTYAVYDTSADTWTIHTAEDLEGEEIDVSISSNGLGFIGAVSNFGLDGASAKLGGMNPLQSGGLTLGFLLFGAAGTRSARDYLAEA